MNARSASGADQPASGENPQPAKDLGETVVLHESNAGRSSPDGPAAGVLPASFGRYRVERLLGRGGMGSVYLAHDRQLNRPVALKIPRFEPAESARHLARLRREAQSVAALHHPNICAVYDVGEIDGIHYLAMAYIKGRSLTEYLKTSKQSERGAALTVFKIAKALEEAHRQGILHRDLKPANIIIDTRGEPIVMDFGLAYRFEDDNQARLTQDGVIIGTPAYMSPEQIDRRAAVGPASDIYSLGVLLYELLTRRCPFEGPVLGVVAQVLHEEPPAIESLRPTISADMARICRTAMAKNPSERFGSMKEFADALSAYIRGKTSAAPLPDLTDIDDQLLTAPLASLGPARTLPTAPGFDLPPYLKWALAAAVAVILLVVALLIFGNR